MPPANTIRFVPSCRLADCHEVRLVAAEAIEDDAGRRAHRQMIVCAGTEDRRQHEVGAFEKGGRHPEAGAEEQDHRRSVDTFETRAHPGITDKRGVWRSRRR